MNTEITDLNTKTKYVGVKIVIPKKAYNLRVSIPPLHGYKSSGQIKPAAKRRAATPGENVIIFIIARQGGKRGKLRARPRDVSRHECEITACDENATYFTI